MIKTSGCVQRLKSLQLPCDELFLIYRTMDVLRTGIVYSDSLGRTACLKENREPSRGTWSCISQGERISAGGREQDKALTLSSKAGVWGP